MFKKLLMGCGVVCIGLAVLVVLIALAASGAPDEVEPIAVSKPIVVEPTVEPGISFAPLVTPTLEPTATAAPTNAPEPTAEPTLEPDYDQYMTEALKLLEFSADNGEKLAEVTGLAAETPAVILRADWQEAVWNGAQNMMDVHRAWKLLDDVPVALQPAHDMVAQSFSHGRDAGFALQSCITAFRDGDMDMGLEWLTAASEEIYKSSAFMIIANELLDDAINELGQ